MTQDAGGTSVPPAVLLDLGGLRFTAKSPINSSADAIRDARILQLEQRSEYLTKALADLWISHMQLSQALVLLAHQREEGESLN